MAVIGAANPTIHDFEQRMDSDRKIAKIVELLNDTNEILTDMTFLEANEGTKHTTTIRTGLPGVTWRLLNYGVAPTKSRTAQVTENTANLEAYAQVDKLLADLHNNVADFRLSEDVAFLEAMNQEMATTTWYGDSSSPEKFVGFAARYDVAPVTDDPDVLGYNVIEGGGSGSDNTSIWLIVWGPNTVHGIFPEGTTSGFQHQDQGEDRVVDANGNYYQAYVSHYMWRIGLVVRDWRYVVRIANIDWSAAITATSAADLVTLMIRAIERVRSISAGRAAFYMRRELKTALRLQILDKTNMNLVFENVAGEMVMSFDGIPVRISDALLNTEAVVS